MFLFLKEETSPANLNVRTSVAISYFASLNNDSSFLTFLSLLVVECGRGFAIA